MIWHLAFLPLAGPQLPPPAGPNVIGTQILFITDSKRPDPVSRKQGRTIAVQFWYPAHSGSGQKAKYVEDTLLLKAMVRGHYYMQKSEDLQQWGELQTGAFLNARAKKGKHPIVVVAPGLGTSRVNYTILCQDLASNGYFVASFDPSHGSIVVMPDGKLQSADDDPEYASDRLADKKAVEWAGDMSFLLTWLTKSKFRSNLDPTKAAAIGHSSGGHAAMMAPGLDRRFHAGVNLDGMLTRAVLDRGSPAAILRLGSNPNYSDEDLAKLGRTRAQWEERVAKGRINPASLPKAKSKPIIGVAIQDTGHLSFSDAPYVFPSAITRFSNHALTAVKTREAINRYVLTFLDCHLKGKGQSLADAPKGVNVEVTRYR